MKTRFLTLLLILLSFRAFSYDSYFPEPDMYHSDINGTVCAFIHIDGVAVTSSDVVEIAAYCDDEIRGKGWVHTYSWGQTVVMNVYGYTGDILTFRMYDHSTSTLFGGICLQTITYVPNVELGSGQHPATIEFYNSNVCTFTGDEDNEWYNENNWDPQYPGQFDQAVIDANCYIYDDEDDGPTVLFTTVNNGKTLTVGEDMIFNTTELHMMGNEAKFAVEVNTEVSITDLYLEDGATIRIADLQYGDPKPNIFIKLNIPAYASQRDNYYLVSRPNNCTQTPVTCGMVSGTYDFYKFNYTEALQWRNYEAEAFDFAALEGYLYANDANTSLTFRVTALSENAIQTKNLPFTSSDPIPDYNGFNLMGNPFACNAAITSTKTPSYYIMNEAHNNFVVCANPVIAPATGFFAVATVIKTKITFTPTDNDANTRSSESMVNVELRHDNLLIDRVYAQVGEEYNVRKLNLHEECTQLYFRQNDVKSAIVSAEKFNQMPLYFETKEYGEYTITVSLENMTSEYLHLIDNVTGADIDLNVTPSYTFIANSSDYASRFRLCFANTGVEETAVSNFAVVEGNRVIIPAIETESNLEIIDMTGRIINSTRVNGNFDQTLNVKAGVYMLRLNGNVQKIVIR